MSFSIIDLYSFFPIREFLFSKHVIWIAWFFTLLPMSQIAQLSLEGWHIAHSHCSMIYNRQSFSGKTETKNTESDYRAAAGSEEAFFEYLKHVNCIYLLPEKSLIYGGSIFFIFCLINCRNDGTAKKRFGTELSNKWMPRSEVLLNSLNCGSDFS